MSNGNVTAQTKLSDVPDFQQVYIPKSTYRHKVVDVEYVEKSKSSGNPMFVLTCEITDHAGFPNPRNPQQIVDPNGTTGTVYLSLTEKAAQNLKRFFKACGLPTDISLEDLTKSPNPEFLRGRQFLAIGTSKPTPQIDELTKQPIKHPVTGQDVIYYSYEIKEVFAV